MVKYKIFVVNDNTWEEHNKVGIAAINDPLITHPKNKNKNSARQSAISEISSIMPGDNIFFIRTVSDNHPPELLGLFEATSEPYFNQKPLYPRASHVKEKLPFRVDFKCIINFIKPIDMDEIWFLKDKGKIWTIQQSRGDAVGIHACVGITRFEAEKIIKLFMANNIISANKVNYEKNRMKVGLKRIPKNPLPIDFGINRDGQLNYEATLQTLLLKDLCRNKHKNILGDYDDFIPYVPTGSRKEIDILLLKYDDKDIIWYEIIELKRKEMTRDELQRLVDYERWLIRNRAENHIQIHPVAIASEFEEEAIEFAHERKKYNENPLRLIKYTFNNRTKSLELKELKL